MRVVKRSNGGGLIAAWLASMLVAVLAATSMLAMPASAQGVPTSASTAGVGPPNAGNGQPVATTSSGLNGLSTGSSAQIQSGSMSAPPASSVVMSTTLDAAGSASLASKMTQAQGSEGAYTSTTGSLIAGISNSLGTGYTPQTNTAMDTAAPGAGMDNVGMGAVALPIDMAGVVLANVLIMAAMAAAGAVVVL